MSTKSRTGPTPRATTAAATAATRLGSAALGLIASVAISRALQPEGRGIYAVAAAIAGIAAVVGSLAVHRALQFEYRHDHGPGSLRAAALWAGGTGGVVGALAVGLTMVAWPTARGPASIGIVALGLCGAPAIVVGAHLSALLVLGERPAAAARVGLWTTAVHSAVLVGLALSRQLTPTLVVATSVTTAALGIPLALRLLPGAVSTLRESFTRARALVRRGLRYQPGYLAQHLLLRVDLLILATVHGARAAGLYSLAVALTEPIAIITTSIAQTGVGVQARGEGGDAYTARLARTSLAVAALLAAGTAMVAGWFIPLLFGLAFEPSLGPLLALLPGTLALAAREPLEIVVSRRDHPRVSSTLALSALGLNTVLNVLLIPRWGPTGAGIASSVAYSAQFVAMSVWFLRVSGLPARMLIPRVADLTEPLRAVRTALQARRR